MLGRWVPEDDPLQLLERRPFDARALGDLSGFPSLCYVFFDSCEVMLCEALLGATRHASLDCLTFHLAYPAPECAVALLQLSQAFGRLGRGYLFELMDESGVEHDPADLAISPYHMFRAALKLCGR